MGAIDMDLAPRRVMFISAIYPWPVDSGKTAVISEIVTWLVERYGASQVHFVKVGGNEASFEPRGFQLSVLPTNGILGKISSVLVRSFILRKKSIQESLIYSNGLRHRVSALIRDSKPDIVICDTIRTAQLIDWAAPDKRIHRVLYLDDLFSSRYRRLLAALRSGSAVVDPLGAFRTFVPPIFRGAFKYRSVQRMMFQIEARLVHQSEIDIAKRFDDVLLLNPDEVSSLKASTGLDTVRTLRPLVTRNISSVRRQFDGTPTFIFLGALNYQPNVLALRLFLREAMPEIARKHKDWRILVVGRHADRGVMDAVAEAGPQVTLVGYVDDLSRLMATAAGLIVPVQHGSGLRIKIVEAMSYGLPVVSTSRGVEGLGATPDAHLLVEDDVHRFPDAMARLLDPGLNETISHGARMFFQEHFHPDRVRSQYEQVFCPPPVPVGPFAPARAPSLAQREVEAAGSP